MPVKNLKSRKIELRSRYKRLRENFSAEKKAELDEKLCENFLALEQYKSARTVFAFVSKDIEVDTENIIKSALQDGKRVAVPLCNTEDTTIRFYYISSFDDLKPGYYGLREPDTEKCPPADVNAADICLVPGLVYDRDGYRLGFGKGYYDRFLTDYAGLTVGICYSRCVEDELPRGFYDKPIKIVVTEKYTINNL